MFHKKELNWKRHIQTLNEFPTFTQKWEREFAKAVFQHVPKKGMRKILEVGCSNGRWLRWFQKEYGSLVYGIDNDPTGFKKKDVVEFILGDARTLPYQNEFFDIVFSTGLIEHFPKKEKYRILKEQARVLRKGGFLICQVPLLSFSLNFLYMKYVYDWKAGYFHYRTTERELRNYFRSLGLPVLFLGRLGKLLLFRSRLRKFYESEVSRTVSQYPFLKRLLATEILIIGKKNL